jgi:hypothetical protein
MNQEERLFTLVVDRCQFCPAYSAYITDYWGTSGKCTLKSQRGRHITRADEGIDEKCQLKNITKDQGAGI